MYRNAVISGTGAIGSFIRIDSGNFAIILYFDAIFNAILFIVAFQCGS